MANAVDLLRGLHKAVHDLSEHFDKPITDENVTLWLTLNSAQAVVAKFLSTPQSESTPTFALAQKLNEIDAARYRWLRNHPKNGEKEWWPSVWMSRDPLCAQPLQAGFLDDEIDNAMRREALNAHMEGL